MSQEPDAGEESEGVRGVIKSFNPKRRRGIVSLEGGEQTAQFSLSQMRAVGLQIVTPGIELVCDTAGQGMKTKVTRIQNICLPPDPDRG